MKKWIFSALLLLGIYAAQAQSNTYKKLPSLGLNFSLIDFKTAAALRTNSLATVLDARKWYRMGLMNPAFTLSYTEGVSDHLDFNSRLTFSLLSYPLRNPDFASANVKSYLESDATVNLKLLTDNYFLVPYLQAGIGAAYSGRSFLAYIPVGAGLQMRIANETFLNLVTNYRIPVTDRASYSLFHSIGIVAPIKTRPEPEPKKVVPVDTDGDGIVDAEDACPTVKGIAAFKGCPDTDKDGITDAEDKCPNEAGIAKYQGCPIPDTDKDGINDENDKCVDVFGVARYEGCPVPDSDGDGLNDEVDRCPAEKGDSASGGCPAKAAEDIQSVKSFQAGPILFASSSSALTAEAKVELDKVAGYLNENKDVSVAVTGYTDNTGSEKINTALSAKRANAAVAYLIGKGIDKSRLTASGLGPDHPVGDNSTEDGRSQNRRVEFKIGQ
jgi:outer membrane protein OmpA-like peptidoglycan-associated protein